MQAIKKFLLLKQRVKNKYLAVNILIYSAPQWSYEKLLNTDLIYLIEGHKITVKNEDLVRAAEWGKLESVKFLCNYFVKNGTPWRIFYNHSCAVRTAICYGYSEIVKYICNIGMSLQMYLQGEGNELLKTAINWDRLEIVKFLCSRLKLGFKYEFIKLAMCNVQIVKFLWDYFMKIEPKNLQCVGILDIAVIRGDMEILEFIWPRIGVNITADVFESAIGSNSLKKVKFTWNLYKNKIRDIVLNIIVTEAKLSIIKFLCPIFILQDPNLFNSDIFLYAVNRGELKIIKYLWEIFVSLEKQNEVFKNNAEAFIEAGGSENLDVLKFFWKIFTQLGKPGQLIEIETFLNAVKCDRVENIQYLLGIYEDLGYDISAEISRAFTLAAEYGAVNSLEFLWVKIIDLNMKEEIFENDFEALRVARENNNKMAADFLENLLLQN